MRIIRVKGQKGKERNKFVHSDFETARCNSSAGFTAL
jgi:hypothetical protein